MTQSDLSDVTLITLSYNSGRHITRCLSALTALEGAPAIIHADNGSSDIDLNALAKQFPTVRQIRHGANLGFAAGMNAAAATVTTEWIGFINPDAFVAPDWLTAMRAAMADYPTYRIFTALQVDADDPSVMDGAGDALSFFGFPFRSGYRQPLPADLTVAEVFAPCGAAMVMRRDLFERLGGFEERFFCYCEDADLGLRAQLLGEATLFVPQARTQHVGSASTSVRSDFALWHGYRNRIWMFAKSMPLPLLIAFLPVHMAVTGLGVIKDTLNGKGPVVWSAIRAAFKGIGPILRSRRAIQQQSKTSALRLAKNLTWNPVKIARRAMDHRRPK